MNSSKLIPFTDAAQRLQQGQVGVIPTDTIYGLAASAYDEVAVTRLYAVKKREHKPGTVIAASIDQLISLGIEPHYLNYVASLWPASLSVVIPTSERPYLHQGVGSLAMRVVADPNLRTILEQTGPLLTSSANQPGEPESTIIERAWQYFGDSVDFYVNGGDLSGRKASTIIRLLPDNSIELLRQGSVDITSLIK